MVSANGPDSFRLFCDQPLRIYHYLSPLKNNSYPRSLFIHKPNADGVFISTHKGD